MNLVVQLLHLCDMSALSKVQSRKPKSAQAKSNEFEVSKITVVNIEYSEHIPTLYSTYVTQDVSKHNYARSLSLAITRHLPFPASIT